MEGISPRRREERREKVLVKKYSELRELCITIVKIFAARKFWSEFPPSRKGAKVMGKGQKLL